MKQKIITFLIIILLFVGCSKKEDILTADKKGEDNTLGQERVSLDIPKEQEDILTENLASTEEKNNPIKSRQESRGEGDKTVEETQLSTASTTESPKEISPKERKEEGTLVFHPSSLIAEMEENKAYVDKENPLEILVRGKYNKEIRVLDTLGLVSHVKSLLWIDTHTLAILGDVNISLECLMIFDLQEDQLVMERYGTDFIWKGQDITTLVYVVPQSFYTGKGSYAMIKNYQDEILYQAAKDMSISQIIWMEENTLSFQLKDKDDSNTEELKIE